MLYYHVEFNQPATSVGCPPCGNRGFLFDKSLNVSSSGNLLCQTSDDFKGAIRGVNKDSVEGGKYFEWGAEIFFPPPP